MTTASEWLSANPDSASALQRALAELGVPIGYIFEYPEWMLRAINR